MGIQYENLGGDIRSGHGLPANVSGIVVTNVAPTSPLYDQRVRPGDVITEVNGQSVGSPGDFERLVKGVKSGTFLRLYVLRPASPQGGGKAQPFFAVVRVP
jgi:S1-C subfamily serine protease